MSYGNERPDWTEGMNSGILPLDLSGARGEAIGLQKRLNTLQRQFDEMNARCEAFKATLREFHETQFPHVSKEQVNDRFRIHLNEETKKIKAKE